jgi:hypothetical protein
MLRKRIDAPYRKEDKTMKNLQETATEKIFKIYDRTIETRAWAGIVLSRLLMNAIPSSLRGKMGHLPRHFDDRRRDRRLHVDNKTITCVRDGKDMKEAHLINISRSGMYVEMDAPPDVGQEMSFALSKKGMGHLMRVKGQVSRRAERGMAVQFI